MPAACATSSTVVLATPNLAKHSSAASMIFSWGDMDHTLAVRQLLSSVSSLRKYVLMNLRAMIDDSYWSMLAAAHLPGEQYTEPVGDPGLFGPDSAIWYVHG